MRIIVTVLVLVLSINAFSQKVTKTYWGNSNNVHEEFQVNSTGAKDGYYKEFYKEGQLFKTGFYKSGQKSGIWTTYDMNWSGQISSTMEYESDKMNGQYKQWCWEKSKRYLCGEYIYKDGNEVSAIKYFANGKKSSQNDANGYFEWFEDGTPGVETKNGKQYNYQMFSADYNHNSEKKEIRRVSYDSLGLKYEFTYDYDTKYDGEHLKAEKLNISVWDLETKGSKTYYRFFFYSDGQINRLDNAGQKIILDSISVRMGYELLKIEPTGYFDMFDNTYDVITGDVKILKNDGYYQLIHYLPANNEIICVIKKFDNNGKLLDQTNEENVAIKESNAKMAKETFEKFYSEFEKVEYDSLSLFTSYFWEHYKPRTSEFSSDGFLYPPCHPKDESTKNARICKYCIKKEYNENLNDYFNVDEIEIIEIQKKYYETVEETYNELRNSTPKKEIYLSQINNIRTEYQNNKKLFISKINYQENNFNITELNKQNKKKILFKKYSQLYSEYILYIQDKNNSLYERLSKSLELVEISNKIVLLFNQDATEIEANLKDAETTEQIKTIILK